ncbi:hypothetical protein [Sphingomonas sp.]|uniref:hypothetical protein n=1 Tax=Sphingomonas sp. TaxID=28214 RepID=UPI002ED878A6
MAAAIRDRAAQTGVSHSATNQKVAQMAERGLVMLTTGIDARERIVTLSDAAQAMLPRLEHRRASPGPATERAMAGYARSCRDPGEVRR